MESITAAVLSERLQLARWRLRSCAGRHKPKTRAGLKNFLLRSVCKQPGRAFVLDPVDVAKDLGGRGLLDPEALAAVLEVLTRQQPASGTLAHPLAEHPEAMECIAMRLRHFRLPMRRPGPCKRVRRAAARKAATDAPAAAKPDDEGDKQPQEIGALAATDAGAKVVASTEVAQWIASHSYVEVPGTSAEAVLQALLSAGDLELAAAEVAPAQGPAATAAAAAAAQGVGYTNKWLADDEVTVDWRGSGLLLESRVVCVHSNGTYDVERPAVVKPQVVQEQLRFPRATKPWTVGCRVEATAKDSDHWCPAKVVNVHEDGTLDLAFQSVETWQENVQESQLRRPVKKDGDQLADKDRAKPPPTAPRPHERLDTHGRRWRHLQVEVAHRRAGWSVGEEVEVYSPIRGCWSDCTVEEAWDDGTYEVTCFKSERWTEPCVPDDRTRQPSRWVTGAAVEVLFESRAGGEGSACWWPGTLLRVHASGRCDVHLHPATFEHAPSALLTLPKAARCVRPKLDSANAPLLRPRELGPGGRQTLRLRRRRQEEEKAARALVAQARLRRRWRGSCSEASVGETGGLGDKLARGASNTPQAPRVVDDAYEEAISAGCYSKASGLATEAALRKDPTRLAVPKSERGPHSKSPGRKGSRLGYPQKESGGRAQKKASRSPRPSPRRAAAGGADAEAKLGAPAVQGGAKAAAEAEKRPAREKRFREQRRDARDQKAELARVDSRPL